MSQLTHHYRKAGLSVASEVSLPGLMGDASGSRAADVVVARRRVPLALREASSRGLTWEISGDELLLRIAGIARFLLSGGRDIAFELEEGGLDEDVPVFLTGVVFGMLMHQRRRIVLHASAVDVRGRAVLFCGPSGVGKSTIAAALGLRGYPLISDDLCVFAQDIGEPPTVCSDGHTFKLWAQTIDGLDLSARKGGRVRPSLEKFYVEPDAPLAEATTLAAIYILREARAPLYPGIDATNAVDAALMLEGSAYRPLLVNCLGQKALYFHAATSIANRIGVFHLTAPRSFAKIPDVVGWLEQHWLELAIMKSPAPGSAVAARI